MPPLPEHPSTCDPSSCCPRRVKSTSGLANLSYLCRNACMVSIPFVLVFNLSLFLVRAPSFRRRRLIFVQLADQRGEGAQGGWWPALCRRQGQFFVVHTTTSPSSASFPADRYRLVYLRLARVASTPSFGQNRTPIAYSGSWNTANRKKNRCRGTMSMRFFGAGKAGSSYSSSKSMSKMLFFCPFF